MFFPRALGLHDEDDDDDDEDEDSLPNLLKNCFIDVKRAKDFKLYT